MENLPQKEFKIPTENKIIISRSHGSWYSEFEKDIQRLALNTTVTRAGGSGKTLSNNLFELIANLILCLLIGYKTISLLQSTSDVYLHFSKIKKWDICAPNAILNNRGGKLLSREGKRIDYSDADQPLTVGFIAALNNFEYFFESFKAN